MKTKHALPLGLALVAVGVALAAAIAATASAAGAPAGFHAAKFKVEVKGTQNVKLHYSREAEGECGVSDHSLGAEHLTFHTKKPIVITAFDAPGGGFNPEFFAGRRLGIPAVATVERSFTPVIGAPQSPYCGASGGGAPPPRPDCGRRHVKFRVNLQYGRQNHDGLLLSSGLTEETLYEDCPQPASVESFPWLLVEQTSGKYIYAQLSQHELFDPDIRKWISIADGSRVVSTPEEWHKSEIHWEVSFTRIAMDPAGA